MIRATSILAIVGSVVGTPAMAHAVLQTPDAAQASVYKAVIALDHGCSGAATTAVRVTIPEGFIAAKPMPKAGWTVTIDKGAYAQPYPYKGGSLAEGAKAVTWQGTLPADDYDEFVVSGFIADAVPAGSTLYFPVIQECGTSAYHWTDTPNGTTAAASIAHPAPGVRIMAGAAVPNSVAIIDHLRVSQPWAHASAADATTTDAYVTIENRGSAADRLTGVTSDVAAAVTITDARSGSDDAPGAPLDKGLKIEPGEHLDLRPGAYHLMLSGLKQPLVKGSTFKATLDFAVAGPLVLQFHVESNDALNSGAVMPTEDAPDRL